MILAATNPTVGMEETSQPFTPSNTPPEAEKRVLEPGCDRLPPPGAELRPSRTYPVGATWNEDGFRHEVSERNGNVALVRKNLIGGKFQGWEVAIIRRRPATTTPSGHSYAEGERYPANEDWGTYGWSYTTEEDARRKVATLV